MPCEAMPTRAPRLMGHLYNVKNCSLQVSPKAKHEHGSSAGCYVQLAQGTHCRAVRCFRQRRSHIYPVEKTPCQGYRASLIPQPVNLETGRSGRILPTPYRASDAGGVGWRSTEVACAGTTEDGTLGYRVDVHGSDSSVRIRCGASQGEVANSFVLFSSKIHIFISASSRAPIRQSVVGVSESFRHWYTSSTSCFIGESCPWFWSVSCSQQEQLATQNHISGRRLRGTKPRKP